MGYKRYLITVTDNLSATSMPFNEFVLYRRTHYLEEKQIVFLLFKNKSDDSVKIPDDIDVYYIGKNRKLLAETAKRLTNETREQGIPIVFHIHEAKSVLLFNVATKFRYCNKIVYTLHSTYKNYPLHNKVFSILASMLCKKIVCVSGTSLKYYPRILKLMLGDKVVAISNGVDVERIDKIREESNYIKAEKLGFTAIYVARLVPLKRHKILLDAVRSLSDVRLLFIGTGPLESELRQYVREIGIEERVEFMGLMPREDVFRHLLQADLYVSSSSYEGLPVGVLEAMACGKPCLVSNIEQHREIKDKVSSLITCDDAPDCWTEKLTLLSAMNQEQLFEIGDYNRRGVKESYSLVEMHKKYNAAYALCYESGK